uniref:Uncharacterized protein n=1 Tax=Tanacetum cinerariifolium TaxID=118510 RepID=A0A6L2LQI8_TANCI|nr:hypothetical protein [Tanacetum cinerariifolium]
MATTINQQVAPDESLVPSTQRLRIGRSNFRLPSDIQSKESTLQVIYDVLRNSPLFRAFQVTADVLEIYMQEFWATAKLHHNSTRLANEKESFDRWVWGTGSHGVLGRVVGYCSDRVRCTVGVCGEDGTLAGKWVRFVRAGVGV